MDAAELSCPFAPVTPDKGGTTRDYQHHEVVKEEHMHDTDIAKSMQSTSLEEDMELQATEHEPSENVSSQESKIRKGDKRENQELELNKKWRKKPKRKKHRPKVIQERKPSRTPKPVTPMREVPKTSRNEGKLGKRSFVKKRKKVLESMDSTSDVGGETVDPDVKTETISVECKLNFDVEGQARQQSPMSTLMNAESQAQEACTGAKLCVLAVQEVQVVTHSRQEGSKHCFHNQKPNRVPKKRVRLTEHSNLPVHIFRRRIIRGNLNIDSREDDALNGSSNTPFVKARENMGFDGDIQSYCTNGAPRNAQFAEACVETGQVPECRELEIHDPFFSITYKRRTKYGEMLFLGDMAMNAGSWKVMKIKLNSCVRRTTTKKLNKKAPRESFGSEDE